MPTPKPARAAQKARALLLESQAEFANGGDHLKACQKLWQAAAQAITAVAQQLGWPHAGPDDLNRAVQRLADDLDEPLLSSCFASVKMFRDNVEFDFMEEFQLKSACPRARHFIDRMLSLLEPQNGGGADVTLYPLT